MAEVIYTLDLYYSFFSQLLITLVTWQSLEMIVKQRLLNF